MIQVYSTDDRDYINEFKDFEKKHNGDWRSINDKEYISLVQYIEKLVNIKGNDKIVIKKYER